MAVTKIRRISSWTLIAVAIISIIVLGLFYLGGNGAPLGEFKNPTYTGELLYWVYMVFAICALSLLLFGLFQFFRKLKDNPKAALASLAIFAAFAILLVIAYFIGDGTPLKNINADLQTYNTPFWLKVTDMWLYSMYILFALSFLAMIWGSVKKIVSK